MYFCLKNLLDISYHMKGLQHLVNDTFSIISSLKAFKDILEGVVSRIDPADTDVRPYEVDGKPYLARVSSPY